jgi:hypothetical protein
MAEFKVLSRKLHGGTEKNHEKPQSKWSVSRPGFELSTSHMQVRNVYRLSRLPRHI